LGYVGNSPALKYTSFAVQHFTTSATTGYTLDHAVNNENDIRLVINNVVQQPGSSYAYTASGTTLTLSAATAGTDTMYCVFLGKAVQTVNPSQDSVGTSQLQANAVTAAKFNADVISGQTELATTPADTDELLLSDSGVLKRIDYSYLKAGDNTPYFRVDTTTQTVGGEAVLIFTNSVFDSASGYNNTNGKYTIPSGQGGYWWFQANANISASYTGMYFNLKVNGTNKLRGVTGNASLGCVHLSGILNVSAADEITVALELGASQALAGTAYMNAFGGFKLIT
jgi:hypothetical protein